MRIAIRVKYPEQGSYNWYDALSEFKTVGQVEVAFYEPTAFSAISLESVKRPFQSGMDISVASVHAPSVAVKYREQFSEAIKKSCKIANALGAKYIIAHPTNGKLEDFVDYLDYALVPILEKYDSILCWETFLGARRLFSGPKAIAEFARKRQQFGMCYDTAHMALGALPILEDFYAFEDVIKVFHISNWSWQGRQHLPLRHPDGVIDFQLLLEKLSQDFEGIATLEYLPKYHDQLRHDALWANEFCY